MASSFDRWEKDPFFTAAEEVQESADRMESTYRTWIHAKKDSSSMLDSNELRRDLHTSVGTTKWQLEEFERAVRSSYGKSSSEDARGRHRDFVVAIEDQISNIEHSLQESVSEGKASLPWVRLDERERNELALFLSGTPVPEDKNHVKTNSRNCENPQLTDKNLALDFSKNLPLSVEQGSLESKEKLHGHRRTASANADIGSWSIAVSDGEQQLNLSNCNPGVPVRKIPSLSGFLSSMESVSKIKLSKNGFRKWKAMDRRQEADTALLQSPQLTRGIDACYERSKSYLNGCDECYDKQLYGWYGAIQRQLQRSQYQVQYSRPVQVAFWFILLLCLIVLIALRAI
ncbi:putative Syntaxin/t-SNARE family protein [Quillaja saponaria]|uniref:Syntaxin/t-SNARE family protein n=1 Tax=Quillaja saponaria TaxID=32244 RepID=A0AAD7LI04_QUISA|nr:putative Syntaxin/t-SNARE family protein [Quillaja saponaria]